jgi:plasmid stabilization system protein ParE
MPRRVILSPRAQAWLGREVAYLAGSSAPTATRPLLQRIDDARRLLIEHPRSGRPGPISDTRRLVVAPYVPTYRERNDDIDIIDIRHSRQRETPLE